MDKEALQCRQRVHRGLPWAAGTPTQTPAPQHPPRNPDSESRPASPAPCSEQTGIGLKPWPSCDLGRVPGCGPQFPGPRDPEAGGLAGGAGSETSWRARVAGRTSGRQPRRLWGAWGEGCTTDPLPGLDSAPDPARPLLDTHPSLDPWPSTQHPPCPAPPRSQARPQTPRPAQPLLSPRPLFDPGPCRASAPRLYPPHFGSPPRPTARPHLAPRPARPHLGPVSALTAPAQPHAGPQLSPRPRLGPSPASPSAAAAQLLLGGRRWFRSHKMAALTAATSVPAAAGDAGERGGPARSPTHSPAAACTRRLRAGGGDETADKRGAQGRRLSHRCACAHPSFPPPPASLSLSPDRVLLRLRAPPQWSAVEGALASVSQMHWLSPVWALRSRGGGAQVPAPLPSLSPGDCSDPRSPVRARGADLKKQDPRSNKAGV